MGQCKYCGKKGFFTSVDSNGLCNVCAPRVLHDIKQRFRVLQDSLRMAQEGKTFKTRLSRCDLLLEHAQHLLTYEQKGIPTFAPSPSEILEEFGKYRDQIVLEEAQAIVDKAKEKADIATTPKTKHNALANGLLKAKEIFEQSHTPGIGNEIEIELKQNIFQTALDGYLEAAKIAEFKNNTKKAIDQYQEALYFITNDVNSDEHSEEIKQIKDKLDELKESD